jgi:hypothetical protein
LEVPVVLPTTGCGGESADRCVQADVPGSSEPSGQSQKSSLIWEMESVMDGCRMQVKESVDL